MNTLTEKPGSFNEFQANSESELIDRELVELYTAALLSYRESIGLAESTGEKTPKVNALLLDVAA